jgi:hypothetical protein
MNEEEYSEDDANPYGIDRAPIQRYGRRHRGYGISQEKASSPIRSVHSRNLPVQQGAIYDAEKEPGGFQHEKKPFTRGKQHGVYDWAKEPKEK